MRFGNKQEMKKYIICAFKIAMGIELKQKDIRILNKDHEIECYGFISFDINGKQFYCLSYDKLELLIDGNIIKLHDFE